MLKKSSSSSKSGASGTDSGGNSGTSTPSSPKKKGMLSGLSSMFSGKKNKETKSGKRVSIAENVEMQSPKHFQYPGGNTPNNAGGQPPEPDGPPPPVGGLLSLPPSGGSRDNFDMSQSNLSASGISQQSGQSYRSGYSSQSGQSSGSDRQNRNNFSTTPQNLNTLNVPGNRGGSPGSQDDDYDPLEESATAAEFRKLTRAHLNRGPSLDLDASVLSVSGGLAQFSNASSVASALALGDRGGNDLNILDTVFTCLLEAPHS